MRPRKTVHRQSHRMSTVPITRTRANVHRPIARVDSYLLTDELLCFTFRLDISRGDYWPEDILCRDIHERPRSFNRKGSL